MPNIVTEKRKINLCSLLFVMNILVGLQKLIAIDGIWFFGIIENVFGKAVF
jgi:hypothetical protein